MGNSWGYQTISFELTTANGKKFMVSRGPEEFTKNYPSTFTIQPGEHQVYAIHLDKWWATSPALPKTDEMPITLKAVYQVLPTKEATEHKPINQRLRQSMESPNVLITGSLTKLSTYPNEKSKAMATPEPINTVFFLTIVLASPFELV